MNLNDQPYAYGNENWKFIQPKVVVPTQTLAHSFRHNEVKYFDYVHQSEPTITLSWISWTFWQSLCQHSTTTLQKILHLFTFQGPTKFCLFFQDELKKKLKIFFSGRRHRHRGHNITRLYATCGCCSLLKHLYYIFCTTKETDATEVRAHPNVWITGRNSTVGGVM